MTLKLTTRLAENLISYSNDIKNLIPNGNSLRQDWDSCTSDFETYIFSYKELHNKYSKRIENINNTVQISREQQVWSSLIDSSSIIKYACLYALRSKYIENTNTDNSSNLKTALMELIKYCDFIERSYVNSIILINVEHIKKQYKNEIDETIIKKSIIENLITETESDVKNINQYIGNLDVKVEGLREEYTNQLMDLDEYITDKKNKIETSLGIATSTAVAGTHHNLALDEKRMANTFRTLSLMIMILGIMATITPLFNYIDFLSDVTTSSEVIRRLVTIIGLSIPAAYLAREATKHRDKYYVFLQISLDRSSIDEYCKDFPESIQQEIRKELVPELFGQKLHSHSSKDSYPIDTNEIIKLLTNEVKSKAK